jgi:hypothetical protein
VSWQRLCKSRIDDLVADCRNAVSGRNDNLASRSFLNLARASGSKNAISTAD